mgnify:FL=1
MANLTHNLNTFEEVIQIRKLIASIYWGLKKDCKGLLKDDDRIELKEVYYDLGMLVGYSKSINKDDLAGKFINKFMNE